MARDIRSGEYSHSREADAVFFEATKLGVQWSPQGRTLVGAFDAGTIVGNLIKGDYSSVLATGAGMAHQDVARSVVMTNSTRWNAVAARVTVVWGFLVEKVAAAAFQASPPRLPQRDTGASHGR